MVFKRLEGSSGRSRSKHRCFISIDGLVVGLEKISMRSGLPSRGVYSCYSNTYSVGEEIRRPHGASVGQRDSTTGLMVERKKTLVLRRRTTSFLEELAELLTYKLLVEWLSEAAYGKDSYITKPSSLLAFTVK